MDCDHYRQKTLPNAWKCLQKKYSIVNIVGEGSFGQVVKAFCIQTQQPVAIKYISNAFVD